VYPVPALALAPRTHHVFTRTGNGGGGFVTTLDVRPGRVLRVVPITGNPSPPLLIPRTHRVMVATQTGLTVLDARSGRLVHTVPATPPGLSDLVTDDQARVLAAMDGTGHAIILLDPCVGYVAHPSYKTAWMGHVANTLVVQRLAGPRQAPPAASALGRYNPVPSPPIVRAGALSPRAVGANTPMSPCACVSLMSCACGSFATTTFPAASISASAPASRVRGPAIVRTGAMSPT